MKSSLCNKLGHSGKLFRILPSSVKVLSTPTEFFDEFRTLTKEAEERIRCTCLYVGESSLEAKLTGEVYRQLKLKKDLDALWVVDYHRSQRNTKKGTATIQSLTRHISNDRFRIGLLENPNGKKGIWKNIKSGGRKEALKEVPGVHHMKMFVFDDNVILTGANLERQYLNDRQDRYWVINDKALADHLSDCIEKLHSVCHVMTTVGMRPSEFVLDAHYEQKLAMMIKSFSEPEEIELSSDDTCILFTTQSPPIHTQDSDFIGKLIGHEDIENLRIATGYFNLSDEYQTILKNRRKDLKVLICATQSNSFWRARGWLRKVTPTYEAFARYFMDKMEGTPTETKEWLRTDWTYHAKGIWGETPNGEYISTIGSSNYGMRSTVRDTEGNFTLFTQDEELKQKLEMEWNDLWDRTKDATYLRHKMGSNFYPWLLRTYL